MFGRTGAIGGNQAGTGHIAGRPGSSRRRSGAGGAAGQCRGSLPGLRADGHRGRALAAGGGPFCRPGSDCAL